MKGFKTMPGPIRTWCRRHLFNVVHMIDFGLIAIKNPNIPIKINYYDKKRLKKYLIKAKSHISHIKSIKYNIK